MSVIQITDANTGSPIDNATIICGGCRWDNIGGGFYVVDADVFSAPVATAPGYIPAIIGWWALLFDAGTTMTPESKLIEAGSGPLSGDTGDTGDDGASKWQ